MGWHYSDCGIARPPWVKLAGQSSNSERSKVSEVTTETERRLQEEKIAWLTTVPVWFL